MIAMLRWVRGRAMLRLLKITLAIGDWLMAQASRDLDRDGVLKKLG